MRVSVFPPPPGLEFVVSFGLTTYPNLPSLCIFVLSLLLTFESPPSLGYKTFFG